jgi:hypothetical protein
MKLPSDRKIAIIRNEFARQIIAIKKSTYWPDFRLGGVCSDPDDDGPSYLQITFGTDEALSTWSFQTGDNSYTGGAYGFPYWGICYVRPTTNSKEAAMEAIDQILESIAQSQP